MKKNRNLQRTETPVRLKNKRGDYRSGIMEEEPYSLPLPEKKPDRLTSFMSVS